MIRFHQDMAPYIYELVEQQMKQPHIYFTTYAYEYIIRMKRSYSPRLYEILKSYQYNNIEWFFDLNQLKALLADFDENTSEAIIPKNWSNFAVFKRDVLEPAKKDINTYSDLKIDYTAQKVNIHGKPTRGYSLIHFSLRIKQRVKNRARKH